MHFFHTKHTQLMAIERNLNAWNIEWDFYTLFTHSKISVFA